MASVEQAVRLSPDPQAPGIARRWLRELLASTGHPELIDSATLALSELVTNAVLHARTSITVAVRDEGDDVLIEVADTGSGRLQLGLVENAPEATLTTVGNGLQIISALARRWGVRDGAAGGGEGKTVWFVPARAGEEQFASRRFPPDLVDDSAEDAGADDVAVTIVDVPVRLLWETRFRVRDLRREMILVTMQDDTRTGVPHRLQKIASDVETLNVAVLVEDERFEEAFHRKQPVVTLHYGVPPAAGPACALLAQLLDEADEYARRAQLLTLAASPDERRLRWWFLAEFDRQVRGKPPIAWPQA